ncbi:hypothetical protein G3I19_11195 [Streptomyces sp. SID10853]|uniref:hypothetical protein n=1 Tax=Streptomyces sp. SID10853 TaxID=2706028 RepID=UPI0013BEC038|nr:hypothetical protein [Streptomyces sp. SID10853]NDZ79074.1 hypothetical protein [Streptomyces sp. SID10853]
MRRQHAAIAATATALCLGGLVAACAGGTAHHGYAAVGAAGAGQALTTPVPPSGKVTLTPLDGPGAAAGRGGGPTTPGAGGSASGKGTQGSSAPGGANSGQQPPGTGASGGAGSPDTSRTPGGPSGPSAPGGSSGSSTSAPPKSGSGASTSPSPGGSGDSGTSPSPSAGPAVLKAGAPDRAATDKRWCEKVTVRFSNTGGSPVASGTVTFSTHIIGGLGVDWATRTSKQPLPAPIAAGAAKSRTYTVCVDDWRVPLGMHIETRKVSVSWK